jgi:hypothetical protein
MAVIGTSLTLLDHAKRMDPDGSIAAIAEILNQANEVVQDVIFREGNLPTGHRVSIRTGLPTVYFRMLNQGVPSSKSTTTQVDEGLAYMEARTQIDVKEASLNGNTAEFRLSESRPMLESMAQTFASKLFYGNTALDPEQFTGLATRYSDDSGPANAENIVDGLGRGTDNTSIWLIRWSEEGVFGIYPKGSKAGINHQDLGEQDAFDANGNRFRAFMDLYQWDCGLVVKNWKYAVRIANIDVSNLIAQASAADLLELMAVAVEKLPTGSSGNTAFYCNRTVRTMLRIQCMNRPNVYLTAGNEEGKPKLSFDGIPIRLVDQLLNTESAVL